MARVKAARMLRSRYKQKAWLLGILLTLVLTVQFVFPHNMALASWYNSYIFRPFQSARNVIFGAIPFSIGDALYLIGGFVVVAMIIRWIYLLVRIRTQHHELAHSFINSMLTLGVIYLFFFIGWGGNYYKPTLSAYWAQ